jgi:hypothetical protein
MSMTWTTRSSRNDRTRKTYTCHELHTEGDISAVCWQQTAKRAEGKVFLRGRPAGVYYFEAPDVKDLRTELERLVTVADAMVAAGMRTKAIEVLYEAENDRDMLRGRREMSA